MIINTKNHRIVISLGGIIAVIGIIISPFDLWLKLVLLGVPWLLFEQWSERDQ